MTDAPFATMHELLEAAVGIIERRLAYVQSDEGNADDELEYAADAIRALAARIPAEPDPNEVVDVLVCTTCGAERPATQPSDGSTPTGGMFAAPEPSSSGIAAAAGAQCHHHTDCRLQGGHDGHCDPNAAAAGAVEEAEAAPAPWLAYARSGPSHKHSSSPTDHATIDGTTTLCGLPEIGGSDRSVLFDAARAYSCKRCVRVLAKLPIEEVTAWIPCPRST